MVAYIITNFINTSIAHKMSTSEYLRYTYPKDYSEFLIELDEKKRN